MSDTPPDLASLLCSKLCHDLLSPVGAITNGLELLAGETDKGMREQCMQLLEQSAKISADKLKFFRLAFGAAGGFGDNVPVDEARPLVDALVANNERVQINWQLGADAFPKPAIKTLLNLSLIAIEALVRGGTVDIAAEMRDGATEIVVRASGPRIAFDEQIGHALDGSKPIADLSARTAPATMLHQLAQGLGGRLQFARADDALVLGAVLPVG